MNHLEAPSGLHRIAAAMRSIIQDLRFAIRLFRASPSFVAVAVLMLGLGMAAATTVFSWIDGLLLRPFPGASRPSELAVMEMSIPSAPNGGTSMSWVDYLDYRDHMSSISAITMQRPCALSVGESDRARLAWGELVSSNYFEVLGVEPVLGRMFTRTTESDTPGAFPVVVISERMWRSYFRSDRGIIGKALRVNRRPMTIVAVAPDRFHGTAPAMLLDIWIPASMGAELGLVGNALYKDRGYRDFATMIARLKPGVSLAQAQAEVKTLADRFSTAYPNTNRGVSATILPPWRAHAGAGELLLSPLCLLLGLSVLLLLIVCSNVANLLLARAVGRQREIGIRLALGATRWRVAHQLGTETALLAFLGGGLGFLLMPWFSGSLVNLLPSIGLPIVREMELNGRIVAFTALCCFGAALIAGAAPAVVSLRSNLAEVLNEGGRGGSSGAQSHRARSALVIGGVALATVALCGAGLFIRSFRNARQIDPGLDTSHVLFGRIFMEGTTYTGVEQKKFALRLRQSLQAAPGVQAVSYSDFTPLSTTAGPYDRLEPEGYVPAPGESLEMNRALISPGYFASVRIPLLAGRDFTDQDSAQPPTVAIVNETFAHRYFQSQDPLGRKIKIYGRVYTVVGLARDSKIFTPAEPAGPFAYLPFNNPRLRELYVFVRTAQDPAQAIPTLRHAITATDANVASFHTLPLAEYTQVALFPQKVAASLMGALGLMCLVLAALGLYSLMSYAVSQRTQEIGIRMAMGAEPATVIGMVVRQGMSLAITGLAAGLAVSLIATRLVTGLLVNVSAYDAVTFGVVALFLSVVTLVASWLPALRATRINPTTALRRQ